MTEQLTPQPWARPGWLADAGAWIHAAAERHGLTPTGPVEQPHTYPWSCVLRLPTTEGALWFKAPVPSVAHEVAVTQALAGWHPDCLVELLEADTGRGWMLMRDAGTPLRAQIRPTKDLRPWRGVLARYAELQIELSARVPELLQLGAPDQRLAQLPALFEQLLTDTAMLRLDQSPGLSAAEHRQLLELAQHFQGQCAELATFGIPESLNHGDLHDGNVLVRAGRAIFFDWGDGCVTHPFVSLRTVFVSVANSLELDDFAFTAAMAEMRDEYLEPWTRYAPREELRAAATAARRIAPIVGALGWHRVLSTAGAGAREKYPLPVPGLLQEYLEPDSPSMLLTE